MSLSLFQQLFPQLALRRIQAQTRIMQLESAQKRYYQAGETSQQRRVVGADVSPQAIMQQGGEVIRQHARNLDENNDIAIAILDCLVNNVIGTGLPVQPLIKNLDGTLNIEANAAMAQIWERWAKKPTACRQETLGSAERLICRAWLRDGEVLVNKMSGNIPGYQHAGPVPYTLELMESDFLPYQFSESRPRLVIQGVEVSPYYEPIAYYLARIHPGDIWNAAPQTFTNESDYRRVAAANIIHLKFSRRINQVRGVSILHGVIRRIEDIGDYTTSECVAARVASAMTGFIKRSPDAVTDINAETGERDLEMSPGMIFDNLLPGEDIGSLESHRPNTAINEFSTGLLKRVAAASMTNYSTITRDYGGSYSSQRQGLVEAKPNYDTLREYFVNRLIRPVYAELVQMALTTNQLVLGLGVDRDTVTEVQVANVPMPWIDPEKETKADLLRINGGLTSKTAVISERGGDPAVVARQRENDVLLFGKDTTEETPNEEPDTPDTDNSGADHEQTGASNSAAA